ncbi:PglB [Ruminococcus sp.]|uniref:PglD-related sugar-binding protein n=1 Tax=Ruminococcus sp. TaxID=41978 RepID=UPI002B944249|nr:PglB [Ruminococcus sp.]HNZ99244.1 PglB [Ruminococcus sp.]
MSNLLILGAGQYGMVANEIARTMKSYDSIDFLDDNNPDAIGKLNEFERFREDYDSAVVAIGNAELRLSFLDKLKGTGFNLPVLIHEKAYVAPSAAIERGSFVEPFAVIHTDVKVGVGCIISAGTIINHNAVISDGCHLNCGTIVESSAVVPERYRSDYGQDIR